MNFLRCSMNDVHAIMATPAVVSVTAGKMKLLGTTTPVVALGDEVAGIENSYARWAKKIIVEKDTGAAIVVGGKVGLNSSTLKARAWQSGDTVLGTANKAVGSADTTVEIFFNPTV